jgi:hypothetical protein
MNELNENNEEDDDDEDDDDEDEDDDEEIEEVQSNQIKSLFDIFGNPSQLNQAFIDPTITEKENSKPNLKQEFDLKSEKLKKKLSKKQRQTLKRERKALGVVSKKEQKKIEFLKKQAEKQKREIEWKDKLKETLCKFYLEGRCTKGDDCQFSHNAPVNKKLEVCKYYLNGYCAKNSNCTFMHAEFPCKFYHLNNKECLNGTNCRFSHAPMTTEIREIFEKYLKDNDDGSLKKSSLLGSPPRYLQDKSSSNRLIKNSQQIPSLLSKTFNQSIPSLMDISIQTTKSNNTQANEKSSFYCQDIDERSVATAAASVTTPIASSDIDERAPPPPKPLFSTNLIESNALDTNILIAKLLQQQQQQQLPNLVNNLLSSLTTIPIVNHLQPTASNGINEQKLLLSNLFNSCNDSYSRVGDGGGDELTIDDGDDSSIEIDARTNGLLPYNIELIDIEPSSLWTNPPSLSKTDSECVDPRIEFYSNKLNNKNDKISNSLNNHSNQNIQQLVSSLMMTSASSPPQQNETQKSKDYRDPRLLNSKTLNSSNELNDNSKSLLSSLPDFKLPYNKSTTHVGESTNGRNSPQQQPYKNNDSNNVVKLSIQDYKRKTQKPGINEDYLNQKTLNNYSSNQYQQQQQQQQHETNPYYLPQLSSFSINNSLNDITPPQCKSLHELLKNFPS